MTVPWYLQEQLDILDEKVVRGRWIKEAAKLSLKEFDKFFRDESEWLFREEEALRVIEFLECLPHTQEVSEDNLFFRLEPWQKWFVAEVWGWWSKRNPRVRRYKDCIWFIGRKNGKSFLTSGLALYELKFMTIGAECYVVSNSQAQSKRVFKTASDQIRHLQLTKTHQKLTEGYVLQFNNIFYESSFGRHVFTPLSSKSSTKDGLSSSFIVVDEASTIEDHSLIQVLRSSMGARPSSTAIYISTASDSNNTLFQQKLELSKSILELKKNSPKDDRLLAHIYEVDQDDKPLEDPKCWVKANPNLGISLTEDYLQRAVEQAKTNDSDKHETLVKHFNIFRPSRRQWFDLNLLKENEVSEEEAETLKTGPCFIGVDLALRDDFSSVVRLWSPSRDRYFFTHHCWTNSEQFSKSPSDRQRLLESSDCLTIVDGTSNDLRLVRDYLEESQELYEITKIGVDRYGATGISLFLEELGLDHLAIAQTSTALSWPIKQLDAAYRGKNLLHLHDPLFLWQAQNLHFYQSPGEKAKDLVSFSKPPSDSSKKIDTIAALVNAFAVADFERTIESQFRPIILLN